MLPEPYIIIIPSTYQKLFVYIILTGVKVFFLLPLTS